MPTWIVDFLMARLERHSDEGLAKQLTRLIREAIVAGRFTEAAHGEQGTARLPASRELARQLQLGRNTVIQAYEQLQAEGYLETRQGAGSFVVPAFLRQPVPTPVREQPLGLSRRGQTLTSTAVIPDGLSGAFAPGMPEIRQFPHHVWQNLLSRHQRSTPWPKLGYTVDGGLPALREALAEYLVLSRGVRCTPEQILIISGAQIGMELSARLLANQGEVAWVEEPGYAGAHASLQAAGMDLVAAAVDDEGLNPDSVQDTRPPRLIYTTPSHQYPLGVVMSLPRRLALLAHAARCGAWILEDDYDSEFRYSSQPLPALQGLAQDERVIYIGTMSKVMYPGLRIAYMVVPDGLIDAFRRAHARLYREPPYVTQAALADFLLQGHFARHVRRMRELYQTRQHTLRSALASSPAHWLPLSSGKAGLHLMAHLPMQANEQALSHAAAAQGVVLRPLARNYLGLAPQKGLVLGYAGVNDHEIQHGVATLARLLQEMPPHD